jgi:hypothetical protein
LPRVCALSVQVPYRLRGEERRDEILLVAQRQTRRPVLTARVATKPSTTMILERGLSRAAPGLVLLILLPLYLAVAAPSQAEGFDSGAVSAFGQQVGL